MKNNDKFMSAVGTNDGHNNRFTDYKQLISSKVYAFVTKVLF